MDKEIRILPAGDQKDFKTKMLNWADRFNIFCLLDNNYYQSAGNGFEWMLAAGSRKEISFTGDHDLQKLQSFRDDDPDWLFGHFSYNALGNAYTDDLPADIDFGRGFFFQPQILLRLKGGELELLKADQPFSEIWKQISETVPVKKKMNRNEFSVASKDEYIESIEQLHRHIRRGDCYEINFCRKFSAENAETDPVAVYQRLTALSPVPFAALYKLSDKYCICASPERFLRKQGSQLISQPIKGTSPRYLADPVKDEQSRASLLASEKERSENVMIVDLVRNDLSIVCEKASVKVKELFGIYTFPRVHHMISTIEGTVSKEKKITEILEACYPMGSMTGAPKKKVMELIERYEKYDRGLFSGSVGYISPEGDFDFNVVIRSIFADTAQKKISFFAGSGITFNSVAENEYEECEAKAEAMMRVLSEGI